MPEPNERYYNILTRLNNRIGGIGEEHENLSKQLKESILAVRTALETLREQVVSYGFKSERDEIDFFKNIKPQVTAKLVFYTKVRAFELKIEYLPRQTHEKFIRDQYKRLSKYFTEFS